MDIDELLRWRLRERMNEAVRVDGQLVPRCQLAERVWLSCAQLTLLGRHLRVGAPNEFIAAWIVSRYGADILAAAATFTPAELTLHPCVEPRTRITPKQRALQATHVSMVRKPPSRHVPWVWPTGIPPIEEPCEYRLGAMQCMADGIGLDYQLAAMEWIAERFPFGWCGALLKAAAFTARIGVRMTAHMVSSHLSEYLTRVRPAHLLARVEVRVCERCGVTPFDLHSPLKTRAISLARSLAMYVGRAEGGYSYPVIAAHMGGKNHATVILACRRIERLLAGDEPVKLNGALVPLRQLVGDIESARCAA